MPIESEERSSSRIYPYRIINICISNSSLSLLLSSVVLFQFHISRQCRFFSEISRVAFRFVAFFSSSSFNISIFLSFLEPFDLFIIFNHIIISSANSSLLISNTNKQIHLLVPFDYK